MTLHLSPARALTAAVLALGLSLSVTGTAGAADRSARHDRSGGSLPDRIELPDGFAPEGIVSGRGPLAYVGSLTDGDIYRANLRTGEGRVVSQGDGTPSVGMRLDHHGRLWVAGGDDGDAKVVSTRTGRVIKELTIDGGFVNDVILTRRAAYFTDSQRAVLHRVTLSHCTCGHGPHHTHGGFHISTVPLRGEWEQVAGFNANGIATTPGGRALLVVNSASGKLYRVSPRTGAATLVDLGGASLTTGDGMLREGRTLYVVRNRLLKVAELRLNRRGTAGRLVEEKTSPDFDVPTTVAGYRDSLFLPNARFGTPMTPTTEYWITRIAK